MAHHFREARRAKPAFRKSWFSYCGRHDFGTRLFGKTPDLNPVMETVGHKDLKSVLRYQHPNLEVCGWLQEFRELCRKNPRDGAENVCPLTIAFVSSLHLIWVIDRDRGASYTFRTLRTQTAATRNAT